MNIESQLKQLAIWEKENHEIKKELDQSFMVAKSIKSPMMEDDDEQISPQVKKQLEILQQKFMTMEQENKEYRDKQNATIAKLEQELKEMKIKFDKLKKEYDDFEYDVDQFKNYCRSPYE